MGQEEQAAHYFGRSEADLTPWLEYFIATLAEVFEAVRIRAQKCAENGRPEMPEALLRLDHRARVLLGLFAEKQTITAPVGGKSWAFPKGWPETFLGLGRKTDGWR